MAAKVSHQQGRTGYAAHNDRSMYEPGQYDLSRNIHWDWTLPSEAPRPARAGADSVNAERAYYRERFGALLEDRNARRIKAGHPEEVWTLEQYADKNPAHETILQLGKLNDDTPQDLKEQFAIESAKLLRAAIWEVGGDVISMDIHFDESSPHAHVRWMMTDSKGKPNVTGNLREHGYGVAGKESRKNNPLKNWSAEVLENLEELAERMGAELDLNRISRPNMTVQEYKAKQALKEALAAQERARQIKEKAEAAERQMRQKHSQLVEKLNADLTGKRYEKDQLEREISKREERVKQLEEQEKSIAQRIAALIVQAENRLNSILAILGDKAQGLRAKMEAVREGKKAIQGQRDSVTATRRAMAPQHRPQSRNTGYDGPTLQR